MVSSAVPDSESWGSLDVCHNATAFIYNARIAGVAYTAYVAGDGIGQD